MKKIIALVVASLVLSPALCSAQESAPPETAPSVVTKVISPPATKLETFLGKRGLLVIRDFQETGKIEKTRKSEPSAKPVTDYYVTITALKVYEPGKEAAAIKGLQVSLADFRGVTKYGTGLRSGLSFVDLEEADSLSKALQYLTDLANKWNGQDVGSKEAYFTTQDDFKVLLTQDNDWTLKRRQALQSLINRGLLAQDTELPPSSISLIIDGSSISLRPEEMLQLKSFVDKGIELLKKP